MAQITQLNMVWNWSAGQEKRTNFTFTYKRMINNGFKESKEIYSVIWVTIKVSGDHGQSALE